MRLPPFEIERFFARYEFAVPYLLSSSDVEALSLAELLELADAEGRERWERLSLGYTEAAGAPFLRATIAGLYKGIEPDDVLVYAGAEEAIFGFANVALGPGERGVVSWPAYQSLHEVARGTGAEIELLALEHDSGWTLDLDALEAALARAGTRALVVNFPHNPTGGQLDRAAFERVVALAAERGVTLLSDEVYRWLEYHEAERLPAAAELSDSAVSLGVMSKTFALPGLRIGWLVTRDRELLAQLAAFKDYTTICSSAPSEVLAHIGLRAVDDIVARSRAIVAHNLPLLDDFFARRAELVEWVRPRAGAIGFPRFVAHDRDVGAFCHELAAEAGVLLLPGSVYGQPGSHFRIGFGRRNMPEALERLERFIDGRPQPSRQT